MKSFIVFFFFLISVFVSAQDNSQDCFLLKKASKAYCENKFPQAAKILKEFYLAYPDHILSQEAIYGEAVCHYKSGKIKKASNVFHQLMQLTSYNESDTFGYSIIVCDFLQNNCKNILIADYLVNLQHEASIYLYHIEMKSNNYENAYIHLDNARRYYRYWYGCGTNDMAESIRLSMLFSDYYDKVGKPDTAINELMTNLFEPAALPVMYYDELVKMTYEKMKKYLGEQKLQIELLNAVSAIYYEPYTDGHGHEAKHWFINFYGQRIRIAPDYLFSKTDDIESIQNYLRQTLFYSLVFNLPREY